MTAPTSDERREVAEKLRHASHTDANLDVTIAIAILETIGEVHRPIAAVVADLIDPTCHLWPLYDGGFGCDRCFTGFHEMKAKTSYCPACGARVVSGDGK